MFVMHVPVMLLLAFGLAVALNSPRVRGFRFFRALIFLPYVSNLVGAGITFRVIFGSDGILNRLLDLAKIAPMAWLESEWGARLALSLLIIWAWVGYHMIIMLTGYIGSSGKLPVMGLDSQTGKPFTFFFEEAFYWSTPTIAQDTLYIGATSFKTDTPTKVDCSP